MRSEARRQITGRKSVHGRSWQPRVASQTSGAKTTHCQDALDPPSSVTRPARGRGCCFPGGSAPRGKVKLGCAGKEHRRLTVRKPERRQSKRIFCRRHPGRDSDALIEDRRSEGDLAYLDSTLQKHSGKPPRDREATR